MTKPAPAGGLVIRYDYLWVSEETRGREEGSKVRPCAVVVAVPASRDAPLRAMVCGITHSPPAPPDEGIEIPASVKRHLGLDDERSWVVTSEVNIVDWDDPGIVPISERRWAYGFLPAALARRIQQFALARLRSRTLPMVDRPTSERGRAPPKGGS